MMDAITQAGFRPLSEVDGGAQSLAGSAAVSCGPVAGRNRAARRLGRLAGLMRVVVALALVCGLAATIGCNAVPSEDGAPSPNPGDADPNGLRALAKFYRIDYHQLAVDTWDFVVERIDNQPLDDLLFEWYIDAPGQAPREGATVRYAFPVDGEYRVILTAFTHDREVAFALEDEIFVPPLPNLPPIARAGRDRSVQSGELVCLDATGTFDVNGDPITYTWWQISGPPAIIRAQAKPSSICFTAPQVSSTSKLIFGLRARDAFGSTEDTVVVEVIGSLELIAMAGVDQVVQPGTLVVLDGSESSAVDGGELEYTWTQLAGIPVTLDADDAPVVSFVAPVILSPLEELSFELTVRSGDLEATDVVEITVAAPFGPTAYAEDFNNFDRGDDPNGWKDTGADNSLADAGGLFQVDTYAGETAFGTESADVNIHSHYVGAGANTWGGYVFSGRMMVELTGGGIGVTFLSDYPNSDRYYRLRSGSFPGGELFHVAPHGTGISYGKTSTGIQPEGGVWYRFEIEVTGGPAETRIRAKVWEDGEVRPDDWQIDCVDLSESRQRRGTIGLWSMGPGAKYWDDLAVRNVQIFPENEVDCTIDSDQDGEPDCSDFCPADPEKIEPGSCGCGVPDLDADNNGVSDCLEVPAALQVSRTTLSFPTGVNNVAFEVWNAGGDVLGYTISDNAGWLELNPTSGQSEGEHDIINATVNRTGLANGTYTAEIVVRPSVGVPFYIAVSLTVQPPPQTGALTPIARWDVVPRQRINAGETFKAGVVAFSKAGIREVQFHISGQGYSGANPKIARSMTLNDRVNVWEYWVPISASEFASDGPITVEAVVVGNDGGVRDKNTSGKGLEALTLLVNPRGTLPANVAYVSTTGNDSTGAVNDPSRPFKRMSIAMQKLASAQGGKADGGIVRLRPGDHMADGGDVFGGETAKTVDEWITITNDPAAGGTQANTRIAIRGNGVLVSNWLRIDGVTIAAPGIIDGGSTWSVWLSNCDIRGGSGDFPFPVGWGWNGPQYYTELVIRDQRRVAGDAGVGRKIARNLTMINTREDNFQAWPFGVNITVQKSDPGSSGAHADVIQGPNATCTECARMENWIWYNVVATDLHYQGIFVRSGGWSRNNAFVNCLVETRAPIRVDVAPPDNSTFVGKYDHLLMWNCSFLGTQTEGTCVVGGYEATTSPANGFAMKNVSIRGCLFAWFKSYVSAADKAWVSNPDVEFYDNHYGRYDPAYHGMIPDSGGGTISQGNPGLDTNTGSANFARPLSNSPLVGRISPPLVPADATGRPHGATADVGALRH